MPFLMKLKSMLISVGDVLAATAADLNPYYSAWISMTIAYAKFTATASYAKTAVIGTLLTYAYGDDIGDYIHLDAATISMSMGQATFSPSETYSKTPIIGRELGYQFSMTGFEYEHPSSSFTDQTTAANNATANDMNLAYGQVNDASYFGHYIAANGIACKFPHIWLNVGTKGVGTWTITWEYWNGAAWVTCVGISDPTNGWTAGTGMYEITHTPQANWVTNAVNGITAYWVRARVSAYTSSTAAPLGTQSWIELLHA